MLFYGRTFVMLSGRCLKWHLPLESRLASHREKKDVQSWLIRYMYDAESNDLPALIGFKLIGPIYLSLEATRLKPLGSMIVYRKIGDPRFEQHCKGLLCITISLWIVTERLISMYPDQY